MVEKISLDYIKKKRNSLLCGRRLSEKARSMIECLSTVEKGKSMGIPVCDEKEAHNIRSWISNNRKHLKPEVRNIKTTYKKNESMLYFYTE